MVKNQKKTKEKAEPKFEPRLDLSANRVGNSVVLPTEGVALSDNHASNMRSIENLRAWLEKNAGYTVETLSHMSKNDMIYAYRLKQNLV